MSAIESIRGLQRQRAIQMKTRIMNENRLTAIVAVYLGYDSFNDEKKREAAFNSARKLVRDIRGKEIKDHEAKGIILSHSAAIDIVRDAEIEIVERMKVLARELPVSDWMDKPEQRGFAELSLATIVGEAGDLSNYENPGKLWRRMGCAPFERNGLNRMPSTWKIKGGLTKDDWIDCGYSPRRRSIMFVIADCLVKQNGSGPYRKRYDEAKASAASKFADLHDEKQKGLKIHCHKHAMLLTAKLLLRNLWRAWNPSLDKGENFNGGGPVNETEIGFAAVE